eukprot:1122319-Amphidinium_carterae.1
MRRQELLWRSAEAPSETLDLDLRQPTRRRQCALGWLATWCAVFCATGGSCFRDAKDAQSLQSMFAE